MKDLNLSNLLNWRVFIITLILQFVVTSLVILGFRLPRIFEKTALVSPQSEMKEDVMDRVVPKLERVGFNFDIKDKNSFIKEAHAAESFDEAVAYGVVDVDSGEILLEKNFSERLPIASITKVMSAVVGLDLMPLDEEVTVSERAERVEPSKVYLKAGEKRKVELLLNDMLLSSANDSAQALKDGVDAFYGDEVFVKAMNEKAKFLGLKDSHFTNPQGFDNPEHYSSVHDLVVLTWYAMSKYPKFAEIVRKEFEDLNTGDEDRFYLNNWNGLLGVYPGVEGVKIGNTGKAGKTTAVFSQRDGKKLMAVVLGAPGILERDLWAAALLDRGFEKFGLSPVNVTEEQLRAKYATWRQ